MHSAQKKTSGTLEPSRSCLNFNFDLINSITPHLHGYFPTSSNSGISTGWSESSTLNSHLTTMTSESLSLPMRNPSSMSSYHQDSIFPSCQHLPFEPVMTSFPTSETIISSLEAYVNSRPDVTSPTVVALTLSEQMQRLQPNLPAEPDTTEVMIIQALNHLPTSQLLKPKSFEPENKAREIEKIVISMCKSDPGCYDCPYCDRTFRNSHHFKIYIRYVEFFLYFSQ